MPLLVCFEGIKARPSTPTPSRFAGLSFFNIFACWAYGRETDIFCIDLMQFIFIATMYFFLTFLFLFVGISIFEGEFSIYFGMWTRGERVDIFAKIESLFAYFNACSTGDSRKTHNGEN